MLNLSKLIVEPRDVVIAPGVSIRMKPIGYAGLKAAEAASFRGARARLGDVVEMGRAVEENSDFIQYHDEVVGLAEEIMLDGLVARFAESWSGVIDEDGAEAPLTAENWARLRSGLPWAADALRHALRNPVAMVDAEGNA